MLREDAGLELMKIGDMMVLKKTKQLMGHLRMNDRVGKQIMCNIIHTQIYSGLQESVLTAKVFHKKYWSEEITQELLDLGAEICINHWTPQPMITNEEPIMKVAIELYKEDDEKIAKINEMRMLLQIIYVSEIDCEFYKRNITFPPVQRTNSVVFHWNKFLTEIPHQQRHQEFCGNIDQLKWWRHEQYISNGEVTYHQKNSRVYELVKFQEVLKKEAAKVRPYTYRGKRLLKLINSYPIVNIEKPKFLRQKVEELKQFSNEQELKLYTDAGVNLETGSAQCGIIIANEKSSVEVKVKLPDMEPDAATSAESLSMAIGMDLLHEAGLSEKQITAFNDNTETTKTINGVKDFQSCVNEHGWAKYKLWEARRKVNKVTGIWSKNCEECSAEEKIIVARNIRKCHMLAHEEVVDGTYKDANLCIKVDGQIQGKKIGSTVRKLIGNKYLRTMLQDKYNITPQDTYLEERRRVIQNSKSFYTKTANGLNVHGEMSRYRKEKDTKCAVCTEEEDYLHVIKCASNQQDRDELLEKIKGIKHEEIEEEDQEKVVEILDDFIHKEAYEERQVKQIFRGWIPKNHSTQRRSEWASKVIKDLLQFYHDCWMRRNDIRFGETNEVSRKRKKDMLLEKYVTHTIQDRQFSTCRAKNIFMSYLKNQLRSGKKRRLGGCRRGLNHMIRPLKNELILT